MKRALLFIIPVCTLFSLLLTAYLVYHFQLLDGVKPVDTFREDIDAYLLESYKKRSPIGRSVQNVVFNNDDKYVFRPARILDAHTVEGRQAFQVYGMVEEWNPQARQLLVNSYIGKNFIVSFDPSLLPATAYVPLLDKYGQTVEIRENDIVTSVDNEKFSTLFCKGDIISLVVEDKKAIENATVEVPLSPVEIHLSHRLCEQAP